ncbi:hypothetical protein BKA93DRAFT_852747 [Sparassis latifolia]
MLMNSPPASRSQQLPPVPHIQNHTMREEAARAGCCTTQRRTRFANRSDTISDSDSSSYAPRRPTGPPPPPRTHQQGQQLRTADDGHPQLFDHRFNHRKDDPVRFSVLMHPHASLNGESPAVPPSLFDAADFIYYAYMFYTGLLEEHNLAEFHSDWALGDLAHYRMAMVVGSPFLQLLQLLQLQRAILLTLLGLLHLTHPHPKIPSVKRVSPTPAANARSAHRLLTATEKGAAHRSQRIISRCYIEWPSGCPYLLARTYIGL